jgi:hypothetical protein
VTSALLVVLAAAVGVRAALRDRGALTGLTAVATGWLLLVAGLPDDDVLWTAHAPATDRSGWPAPPSRC